jgi:hypothetical protein
VEVPLSALAALNAPEAPEQDAAPPQPSTPKSPTASQEPHQRARAEDQEETATSVDLFEVEDTPLKAVLDEYFRHRRRGGRPRRRLWLYLLGGLAVLVLACLLLALAL